MASTPAPGRIRFRRLFLLIPLLLLGVFLGLRFTVPVEALARTVDRGPVLREVRGTGTLESVQEVPLAFKVGGRIRDLPLEEGTPIRQGQILGHLDPADLAAQLSVAEAGRQQAEAGVGRAGAELDQARATAGRARADFQRLQQLFRDGILSRADLDAAQEKLRVAEAAAKAMEASGLQARRGVALAQGTESLQRIAFAEGRLLSPVDGLLVRRLREPGDIVPAGTPVLTVVSTRKLWVRAWVDETALGHLRLGQPAQVEFRSQPGRAYPARVDRISRQTDRQTHELLVDVEMLGLPEGFAVGQRADVRIGVSGPGEALRVPAAYVDRAHGACFVNRDGRVHRVAVKVGFAGSDYVEILGGLQPGEQVLRSPQAGRALPPLRRVKAREDA